ncbi:uncharacterized protein LOC110403362 [Numida meleagris]|uniref:uncharacterized protein LOC110403362 n=1 Tax=Numida meleagris TaxID=8996 RepID=UPI000B3DA3D7|nr:uncharacterized protein LOC110403362 [Numida meleagris]
MATEKHAPGSSGHGHVPEICTCEDRASQAMGMYDGMEKYRMFLDVCVARVGRRGKRGSHATVSGHSVKTRERIQASPSPFAPAPPAPAAPRLSPAHAAELCTASPHGKGSCARGRIPDGSPGGAAVSRTAAEPRWSGAPSAFCCRRGSPFRDGGFPSPCPRQVMGTSGCDNTPPIFPCIGVSVTNRGNARQERGRRERKARTQ